MKVFTKALLEQDKNLIEQLSKSSGLTRETCTLLYKRGITSLEKINSFINPSKNDLIDPYKLSGISEAVERITKAKEENQVVVIYGDYDADGICATSVLYKALKKFGILANVVVPERENGYGLSVEVIDQVAETYFPDLLITVDCGISNKNEVEYLQEIGIDVIVTDHHEIPEILPDCTVINCKLCGQEYSFNGLCGAGVAYKLAYALIGESANEYLDYVAIATVADNMPLTMENRIIVKMGLDLIINRRGAKSIQMLANACQVKEITSSSLAFGLAPRINAAGRMGNAYLALKFFTEQDDNLQELCNQLISYNIERQERCETLYKEAKELIEKMGVPDKIIVIYKESWQNGLIGIIAARIVEEYHLPCIILSGNNGVLHGSARSIEGINIFETIKSASSLLIDFGGHEQASGVTISKENVPLFTQKLKEYISKTYSQSVYERVVEVDDFLTENISFNFVKELELFEPCGAGNKKPLFAVDISRTQTRRLKSTSSHVLVSVSNVELMYFNGEKDINLLESDVKKQIVFELGINSFNNREYVTGYIKSVYEQFSITNSVIINSIKKACKDICSSEVCGDYSEYNGDISSVNPYGYGKLICVNNPKNVDKINLSQFVKTASLVTSEKGKTLVKVGGISDEEAFLYKEIIFVDKPFIFPKLRGVVNYLIGEESYKRCLTREIVVNIYKEFVKLLNTERVTESLKTYSIIKGEYTLEQSIFVIEIFKELGIIKSLGGYLIIDKNIKNDLTNSKIYQALYV